MVLELFLIKANGMHLHWEKMLKFFSVVLTLYNLCSAQALTNYCNDVLVMFGIRR